MCNLYIKIDDKCKQRKTNVTQMCKQLDIPRSILSELKAERTKSLTTEILCKIADYLECSTDYLLSRTDGSKEREETCGGENDLLNNQSITLLNIFNELDSIKQAKLLLFADELKNNE